MRFILLSIVGAFFSHSLFAADVLPAFKRNMQVPEVRAIDSKDQKISIFDELDSNRPIVVLPIFTSCRGTCPIITQSLKKAFLSLPEPEQPEVVVFSFDANENLESLKSFRSKNALPETWRLVRSHSKEIREFYDSFNFKFMMSKDQFVHPNQYFVLNSQKQWISNVVGIESDASDLEKALEYARRKPGFVGALLNDPEMIAIYAFFGILASLLIVASLLLFRRKNPQN